MRVLLVLMCLLLATPSLASQPAPIKSAEALHKRATKAYKSGERAVAAGLWREALKVRPFWKYGYNLANTLYELKRPTEAWNALQRTKTLGMPSQHADRLIVLREKVSASLLTNHAYIALDVPKGATVTRNGLPWLAPRTMWTRDGLSEIVVTKATFKTQRFSWKHPIGQRWQRRITLQELGPGRLVIVGAPAGATVIINGGDPRSVDDFRVAGLTLDPGDYDVEIRAPGHHVNRQTVHVAADTLERVTAVLLPRAVVQKPAPVSDPTWVTSGIVTSTVGGASLLVGGILLGLAESERSALSDLANDGPRLKELGYEGYIAEHNAGVERFDRLHTGGWVALSIGLAAVIAGVSVVLAAPDVPGDTPGSKGPGSLSWKF